MTFSPARDVVIVDAGGANLGSIRHALERLGARPHISNDAATIESAERVVLPGVGAAAHGMRRLDELGLVDCLKSLQQPLLGVCLGMQMMFERSAEGDVDMLAMTPGEVAALRPFPGGRVPHIGWNTLHARAPSRLLDGIEPGAHVYFVHGFAAPASSPATVADTTHGEVFAAAIEQGNRFGVQFHPERSGGVGARMLANFMAVSP